MTQAALLESDLDADPFAQFHKWFDAARAAIPGESLPEAMTLATTNLAGEVSARICLLKGFDKRGFVFYTNYNSPKGQKIHDNTRAAQVFWSEAQ